MEERIFDRRAVLDMMGGDEDLFRELAVMFIDNAPQTVGEIDAALAAGDRPTLKRGAHTLKGLFATFVCRQGESTARELELAAGDAGATAAHCGALTERVRDHVGALSAALTRDVAD